MTTGIFGNAHTVIVQFDLSEALRKAVGGGLSGAAAMVLQVLLLMVSWATPPILSLRVQTGMLI